MCGLGEPGEIVLRTPRCTRGYVNASPEDERRYVANPFRDDPDDIVYRSGDRGRYALDGSLEILGRVDHQVKVRGVRIEPEGVSAVLAGHPGIESCVVTAGKDEHAGAFLAGYVVPKTDTTLERAELITFMNERVPLAMVPAVWVFMDELPRLSNGKVNRLALPRAELRAEDHELTYVAPRTATEKKLAEIWASVLKVDRIGIHDNFFSIGGHSLRAMQVVSRVRAMFKIDLPIRVLLEAPTIAGIVDALFVDEGTRERVEKTAQLLIDLDGLSEAEVEKLLRERAAVKK